MKSCIRVPTLVVVFAGFLTLVLSSQSRAADVSAEHKAVVNKGLKWLADNQNRDGHWEAGGGQYPLSMTGLAGMAMLMEGSTTREGKYSERIRRAADWIMARAMPNGMLGNPNTPGEAGRYMYGHGFALLFLATVYGEEDDGDRRKKLEEILTKAVKFTGNAQTKRGGWGYTSAADGSDFDEGSVTVTQMQAVRAARNAGISVPKEIIDNGTKYLKESTIDGGVIYSLANGGGGGGRPALTAAAIACAFSAGDYNSTLVKDWFKFCQTHIPLAASGGIQRFGHDEYTHYYFAQAVYMLGDDGYRKLFPKSRESDRLTWTKYRKETFANLKSSQAADGSWQGGMIGPVFITSVHLAILQLDNGTLPLYQR